MTYKLLSSEKDTEQLGQQLGKLLQKGDFIGLSGPLGSGKTFLVKQIAETLGIPSSSITSPTFSLLQEYTGDQIPLYHADLYRISSVTAVRQLGLEEYFDRGIMIVEWYEAFRPLWPTQRLELTLAFTNNDSERRLYVEAFGTRYESLRKQLLER